MEPYANVEKMLRELHAKKKWLDTVIQGLENAMDSPQHRLIETVWQAFERGGGLQPKVDLQPAVQTELEQLAARVGGRRRRRLRHQHRHAANSERTIELSA